ncbi:MAG: hypothetical protein L0Z62_27520, partial [Gemmataceae bacterium]|nr:hypothetical protein [Gemmataceae bacterium]
MPTKTKARPTKQAAAKRRPEPRWFGTPLKRKEDPRLIQGLAHYVDDVRLPDMLYAAILRSPYAHARIESIDVRAARRAPGVLAVVTGEDTRDKIGSVPMAADLPEMKVPSHPALAVEKVRVVGEPVAAVVADQRYRAYDAVDLIAVEYEALPAVT